MSRFPKADLDALKASTDLARVVGQVVALKPQGHDLVGQCPFHDDDTPSLRVTPHKGLWHCFGCGEGGDAIAFVMKQQRVSFRHAVELLRADAPLSPLPTTRSAPKLPSPVSLGAAHAEALAQVTSYYHSTLKDSPEALAYLEKRGLSSSEMVERFKLGYANRTLGLRLPTKQNPEGAALRSALTEVGVFRESGHEHLAGSLVVPLFNAAGDVVGMYGRKLNDNLRAGTPKHLYLPGPHRGVFNVEALGASRETIVCESLIDALTFWCAGFRNVTSSYGVEGFTDELLDALKRASTSTVLIAYDRDDAGDAAAAALAKKLEAEGIRCGRVLFPKGMDANDYALKVQPASKSLGLAIERAREGLVTSSRTITSTSIEKPAATATTAAAPAPTTTTTAAAKTPSPHPLAASASRSIPMEVRPDELVFTLGDRRYRVRGFGRNTSKDTLKVNLLASRDDTFHVDSFDLYAARFRALFIKLAAMELRVEEDVIKADVGRLMQQLEALQDEDLAALLSPADPVDEMTPEETAAALSLLKDPKLLDRVLRDFERCGVIGEETNKLMGYIGMTSRLLDRPLAIVIQSSSSAGKSSLMDAILAFCPDEERIKYSAMTGQSLFYMGGKDLKHKVLAIVEEEGAERASYSLKLLQSEGELTIASAGKDPTTGEQKTIEYRVEGPVMLFLTTTAHDLDEELMNRCLVLSVDEDREQTRAIHEMQRQRRTLEGQLVAQERPGIVRLHQNAQRLLKRVLVVNPFAKQLTFVDGITRTRRDHVKYLTLIDTIAFLHQHQRPKKTATTETGQTIEYIEVTRDDVAMANRLAHVVLGRSLDELPPQTRKLLDAIDAYVVQVCAERGMQRDDVRLTRRELLDVTGFGYTQLSMHLERLIALEYVLVHAGTRGRSFVYELLFDGGGRGSSPRLPGLIDPDALCDTRTTASSRGVSAPSRGVLGGTPENSIDLDKGPEIVRFSGHTGMQSTEPTHGPVTSYVCAADDEGDD